MRDFYRVHAYNQYHPGKNQATMDRSFGLVRPHHQGIANTCRSGFLQIPIKRQIRIHIIITIVIIMIAFITIIIIIIIIIRRVRAGACNFDFQFTYLSFPLVSDSVSNFRFCLRFQRISPIIVKKATSIPTPNTIYTPSILFKLI